MSKEERFYPEVRFGGFTDIDGSIVFYNRVNALIDSSFNVLDVGCGRGALKEDPVNFRKSLKILKNKTSKIIGIDVDNHAKNNPFLDEFRLINADSWPIESNSIELIVCDNVLEHIEYPEQFFFELTRVLKNGGYLCVRTSNRWSYIAMAASIIPAKWHSRVLLFAQNGRKDEDVFPTVYKCNSIRKLKKIMVVSGFDCVVYGYEAEPSYLSFSKLAYFFGVMHQRLAPNFIKPSIFAFGKLRKTSS